MACARCLILYFWWTRSRTTVLGLDDRTAASIYGLYVGGTYLA